MYCIVLYLNSPSDFFLSLRLRRPPVDSMLILFLFYAYAKLGSVAVFVSGIFPTFTRFMMLFSPPGSRMLLRVVRSVGKPT